MTLKERIDKRMELLDKRFELHDMLDAKFELAMSYANNGDFKKANEVFASMDEIYKKMDDLDSKVEELEATKVEEDKKKDAEVLPYEVVIYGKVVAEFKKYDYAELFSKFWQTAHFQRWACLSGYKMPDIPKMMTEIIMEAVPVDESLQFLERMEENIKIRQKNS